MKGAIVIKGEHLWRSTVVTIGSQQADAITVLPSMNGIIAEFDFVDPPAEGRELMELVVWTSEGEDTANEMIEIKGTQECKQAKPGQ